MYSSKQLNKVALFPLCDVDGVLMDALCDTSSGPGTRGDALVFAWRLSLPDGLDVAQAANAVLTAAKSIPSKAWNDQQLLIVRELEFLARGDVAPRTRAVPRAAKKAKETKEWWNLVGRDPLDAKPGQRKTREKRVSRERRPRTED